ncbi:MAG TPA: PadR family transcriptional regulator [Acidimicrobiales bacterium]|nr:PadR family transcriptional regulator [Acidimicrobiales bacterium]
MAPVSPAREPAVVRTSDPPVLILTSLASGPKHGYALTQDIEEFAGVRLGPGTLYGAITRLERRGLIEPVDSDDRRRPYRITPAGTAALGATLADMGRIVAEATARLFARPHPEPKTRKATRAITRTVG